MSFCDWDTVVIDKRGKRGTGESKEAALTRALKSGTAVAEKKVEHAVGGAGVSAKKLDEDSDTFKRECARRTDGMLRRARALFTTAVVPDSARPAPRSLRRRPSVHHLLSWAPPSRTPAPSLPLSLVPSPPPADATVGFALKTAIQSARLAKKMTQKELALAINEKATVIADYEAGRAIPNPSILSKLDRALGVHLPRASKK